MLQTILSVLPGDHPWQNTLYYYDCIPSTNDLAKELAVKGAPSGTVIIAGQQTAGRGRLGRSFYAPEGLGCYLSVILRPGRSPDQLMHLTCAAAVAACNAVQSCAALRPKIKWTNDLVIGTKKLGGILTELSVNSKTGNVDWAVIGIGINCMHKKSDFPQELQEMTTSLLQQTGAALSPALLAGQLVLALQTMDASLLDGQDSILETYKADCMTIGQQIVLIRGNEKHYGTALDISYDGGLVVRFADGSVRTVQSGEVSVRGMYGYV